MPRKGITPVVAIVLLLMMTVAAAGGAYTWVTGIIGQGQEEASSSLNRQIEVIDVACNAGGTSPAVDFFLTNSGSTDIDANSVTIYLFNVSTGNLLDTNSGQSNGNMAPGSDWPGTADFTAEDMAQGRQYRVEFEFDNEDGYTVEGTCQAQ